MVDVPLVLWAFSHPSDLDFDALQDFTASGVIQGSNRITAMRIVAFGNFASEGFASVASMVALASTGVVAFVDSDSFK